MKHPGSVAGFTTLAVLLVASQTPASAQQTENTISSVVEQLTRDLAGEPVAVGQQGPVTLTSGADAMFPSGGWEIRPGAPVLSKIAPTLSKLQHTKIVVGGYTDNTPVGSQLQSVGISSNLDLSCRRAASVVTYLVSQGVNPTLISAQCFGASHPVGSNDTPEGQAKNRRVAITLTGDGSMELITQSAATVGEAEAKARLKAMTDYVAGQKAISFGYDVSLEVVTNDDQKLTLASSGSVELSRPDKVRASRSGGFSDIETVFDGQTLTILGKNLNIYTQITIPGSIDHLVDELRDRYNRPLPAADLLTTDSYDELMADVVDVKDLGSGVIGGTECDHFAFRKRDVDWQIWIAQGNQPYPCRYDITSKIVTGSPEYSVQIRDWKTGGEVAANDITFTAPAGARQVDLSDLAKIKDMGELPGNFRIGGK